MGESQPKIGIKGGFGLYNFGDDVLMLAAYEIIKKAFRSQGIVFICNNADYIRRIIPEAVVVSPDCPSVKALEVIVYGGGTQFYSFPLTSRSRLQLRAFQVAYGVKHPILLAKYLLRKLTRKPSPSSSSNAKLSAIGIGLGPFVANCQQVQGFKKLFSSMDYIAVRDRSSRDLCENWGLDQATHRADLCYFPGVLKAEAFKQGDVSGARIQRVGVIPRDWPHTSEGDSYRSHLMEVVAELRTSGIVVDFLLFSKKADCGWAECLLTKGEKPRIWNPEQETISEFLEVLSSYDAFLSARFHGAVFASILGKPVVCIEVEQKLRLVSELFQEGARLWSYPFDVSECVNHIRDIDREYEKAIEGLSRVVAEQQNLATKIALELERAFVS